jgi:hypothetical protein
VLPESAATGAAFTVLLTPLERVETAVVELSSVVVNGGSCCLLALSAEVPQLVDAPEPLETRSILLAE